MARHQSLRSEMEVLAAGQLLDDAISRFSRQAPQRAQADLKDSVLPKVLQHLHVPATNEALWNAADLAAHGFMDLMMENARAMKPEGHDPGQPFELDAIAFEQVEASLRVGIFKGMVIGMLLAKNKNELSELAKDSDAYKQHVAATTPRDSSLRRRRPGTRPR